MRKQLISAVAGWAASVGVAMAQTAAPEAATGSPTQAATNPVVEEIVVTASRAGRAAVDIPANVSVVTAADLEQSGAANVVEALQQLGGVQFRSTSGNASQAEIALRGFGENSSGRVLVLLDGQRLNRPDMAGLNWLQIPLANVERIEVLRGGQSVLYGDNALAGVVNIVTKKGTPEPQTTLAVGGGSFGQHDERAGTQGTAGPLTYAANLERDATDGYRDRSAYRDWGAGGHLGYGPADRFQADLGLAYNEIHFQLPGYLTKAQMDADPRQSVFPNDDARTSAWNVNLGLRLPTVNAGRFSLQGTYGRQAMQSNLESWMSWSDLTIDSYGAMPKYVLDHDLCGRKNTLLLGLDAGLDRLRINRFADPARAAEVVHAQVDKQTLGLYARDECEIVDRLTLGLGGRAEQARISADVNAPAGQLIDEAKTHSVQVAEASLDYRLGPQSKLFARAGSVFRFPFVDEQVSYIGYGTDAFNADLDTERGVNYEAGAELAPITNLVASVTVFRLNMHDEIAYNAVTMQNENLDDTRRQGVEAALNYALPGWLLLNASYTWTDARFTAGPNDGREIPLVGRHKVTAGGEVALPLDCAAGAQFTYVSRQVLGGDVANQSPELDAYTTVDLRLRYTPRRLAGLEIFGGVDNVFDAHYASVGYQGFAVDGYYPSPGRSWKAGASYRF